jgi:hypothetical protein
MPDKPPQNPCQPPSLLAVLMCTVLGAFLVGISCGVIPIEPTKIHAPMWLIAMMGLLFWLAGASMLLQDKPRLNAFLAALMFALFGVIGGWVALKGESSQFGGGFPFISHATNEAFARWLFGGGAIICFAVAVYALKKAMSQIE